MSSTFTISNRSRYKDTYFYLDDGVPVTGPFVPPEEFLSARRGWIAHTVAEHEVGFPDIIAARYYGIDGEAFWWVVCLVNGVVDPDLDLVPGQVLSVPPLDVVSRFVSRGPRV